MIKKSNKVIICLIVWPLFYIGLINSNAQQSDDSIKIQEIKEKFSQDPKLDEMRRLADYLRGNQTEMTRKDLDDGSRVLMTMFSNLENEGLSEKMNLLIGIRNPRIVGIGIGFRNKEGAVGTVAKKIMEASPGGIVDYFVDSSYKDKRNINVLFNMGAEGIKILTTDLISEPDTTRELRLFNTLAGTLVQNQNILSDKDLDAAVAALTNSVKGLDKSTARQMLGRFYKINHPLIIQMAEEMAKSETDPQLRETAELLAKSFRKNSEVPNKDAPKTVPKSQPAHPASEPTFAKKSTTVKKPAKVETVELAPDNPFPYWIFIIGGVVVIGLVVVLRRK